MVGVRAFFVTDACKVKDSVLQGLEQNRATSGEFLFKMGVAVEYYLASPDSAIRPTHTQAAQSLNPSDFAACCL